MTEKMYMMIFVREDLSPSQRVVQACHAALCSLESFGPNGTKMEDLHLLIFGVESESALIRMSRIYPGVFFYEPDPVDPALPGLSAFACIIQPKSTLPPPGVHKLLA